MKPVNLGGTLFQQNLNKIAIFCIGTGIVLAGAGMALNQAAALPAYLVGAMYVVGISVTALFFSALQFLARAGWSASIRRIPEILGWFAQFALLILLPIIALRNSFYHGIEDIPEKAPYTNTPFFIVRIVVYCLFWFWMHRYIVGNSIKQDSMPGDFTPTVKNFKRSAPFVLGYALTITFAGFDLLMALEPHWFSTIFGLYFFAGNFVSTISLLTLLVVSLFKGGELKGFISKEHLHDLGKLMFAFTIFWTYIHFSQYFLIWYSNLPEETFYYIERTKNGWELLGWASLFLHFVVPFLLLLRQDVKRNLTVLRTAAFILLFAHFIDLSWIVLPAFREHGLEHMSLTALIPAAGMVLLLMGVFLFVSAKRMNSVSGLAHNDPYLQESIDLVS
jgi:hypothetical protein